MSAADAFGLAVSLLVLAYLVYADRLVLDAGDLTTRALELSISGEAKVAALVWPSIFDFSDQTAPTSTAASTRGRGGRLVTLSASDDAGVSGIEYKLLPKKPASKAGKHHFRRFTKPLLVKRRDRLVWRAVDINGNTEATHSVSG